MNQSTDFQIGDAVTWLHSPRGGYGYVFRIPGQVVGFGRGRIKCRVKKNDGTLVDRFINPKNLRRGGCLDTRFPPGRE